MKKWFAIYRETYGITVKYLGEFETCPNHLDEGYLDIVDAFELRAFKESIINCLVVYAD